MSLKVDIIKSLNGFGLRADFLAPEGITVLFGPSGSGKTTLINAVAGLARPDRGRIALGERVLFDHDACINLPVHKRGVGYVFQDARLFPQLSVEGNLNYGRKLAAEPPSGAEFDRIVKLLGIGGLLARRPAKLSGGEAQRIKLASFLVKGVTKEKALFVFDEPTTGLHFHDIKKLLASFDALIEKGHSIIVIEHNLDLIKCADYILDIGPEGGENGGKLIAFGTPEEVAKNKNSITGKYLKEKLK